MGLHCLPAVFPFSATGLITTPGLCGGRPGDGGPALEWWGKVLIAVGCGTLAVGAGVCWWRRRSRRTRPALFLGPASAERGFIALNG